MPMPNQHSCRLREPNLFNKSSFKTLKTKTKGLTIITGTLKTTGKSALEAYRYAKADWKRERALKHCNARGGRFEGASVKKACEAYGDHIFMHYMWNKVKKDIEYGGWKKEEVIKEHAKITDELRNKGYAMHKKSQLDGLSREYETTVKLLSPSDIPALLQPGANEAFMGKPKKKVKLEDVFVYGNLKTLDKIISLDDIVMIVQSKEEDKKIHILIRRKEKDINLEELIIEQLPEKIKNDIVFEYNEFGAKSSYVALYDLALIPKKLQLINLSNEKIEK